MSGEEEWRDVVGYEGKYRASDRGRIRSVLSGRLLKGSVNAGGYIVVRLSSGQGKGRMFYLHRLVCTAFHGPPPSQAHVVNHLNGRKLDCRPQNLSWCTRRENNQHAARLGLLKGRPGSQNPNARLTEALVAEMRRRSSGGVSYTQMARESGVSVASVYRAVVGRTWRQVPLDPLPAHALTRPEYRAA